MLRGSLGCAPNGRSAPGARLRSALTCGRCRPEMLRWGTGSKSGRGEQSPEPPRRRALSPRRTNPPLRAPVPSPGLGRRVGAGFRAGGGAGCRLPRQPCARGPRLRHPSRRPRLAPSAGRSRGAQGRLRARAALLPILARVVRAGAACKAFPDPPSAPWSPAEPVGAGTSGLRDGRGQECGTQKIKLQRSAEEMAPDGGPEVWYGQARRQAQVSVSHVGNIAVKFDDLLGVQENSNHHLEISELLWSQNLWI